MNNARVTIGMPVYNGGSYFEVALSSILNQSFHDVQIIISDNASSDNTEEICRRYAAKDVRITYVRQIKNVGAERNFDFVMQAASSEYFMWAAADDYRSFDYIKNNVEFLDLNSDYVASTCPTRFEGSIGESVDMGDQSRAEIDPCERVLKALNWRCANGRFYSLYRLSVVKDLTFTGTKFMAMDVLFVMTVLMRGKMNRLTSGYVELGRGGVSSSPKIYSLYRTTSIEIFIPFYFFCKKIIVLMKQASLAQKINVLIFSIHLNGVAVMVRFLYLIRLYDLMRVAKRFVFNGSKK